ncbi:MAG TPA: PRC-barrel domain-containing protein [Rubrobacteraceae bacterium]|nr:PRC-barrel domain-containing protein [Rubrobacteraceae bacterium]
MADKASLVKLEDFDGEVEEHWQEAEGSKVLDSNGEEVGTVEEIYVWEEPGTVHLIEVSGEERSFLIPVHAVTNADEEGVKVEQSKQRIMESPEFDSGDAVPDDEARKGVFQHYGYTDPLDLGA